MKCIPKVSISFSGCGFLGSFHVGSLAVWREARKEIDISHSLGSSSGAIVATATALNVPTNVIQENFIEVQEKAKKLPFGPWNLSFDITGHLRKVLQDVFPTNAHDIVSNRVTIVTTNSRLKCEKHSVFLSKSDLIDCLVASCFIPGFSGYTIPYFRGVRSLDGGFTLNQPILDSKTIRISAFEGGSEINSGNHGNHVRVVRLGGEELNLTASNIKRLSLAVLPFSDLTQEFNLGYEKTKNFIENKDKISPHYY